MMTTAESRLIETLFDRNAEIQGYKEMMSWLNSNIHTAYFIDGSGWSNSGGVPESLEHYVDRKINEGKERNERRNKNKV
jgi:hypothetical protein